MGLGFGQDAPKDKKAAKKGGDKTRGPLTTAGKKAASDSEGETKAQARAAKGTVVGPEALQAWRRSGGDGSRWRWLEANYLSALAPVLAAAADGPRARVHLGVAHLHRRHGLEQVERAAAHHLTDGQLRGRGCEQRRNAHKVESRVGGGGAAAGGALWGRATVVLWAQVQSSITGGLHAVALPAALAPSTCALAVAVAWA